ncbi:hypothetical protein VNO80_33301 [Phaseolus coccineus]|uniref:Uncharacterized protein n=1 Tax=Phaseolus coccineus TaxID=3886 RepID=A0AAN9L213_PHACN
MRMLLLAGSMPRASNGQTRIPLVATLPLGERSRSLCCLPTKRHPCLLANSVSVLGLHHAVQVSEDPKVTHSGPPLSSHTMHGQGGTRGGTSSLGCGCMRDGRVCGNELHSRPTRAGAGATRMDATWLILPVVICLSQRLSHACGSIPERELRNGYHIQGRQQARKLPNPDTGRLVTINNNTGLIESVKKLVVGPWVWVDRSASGVHGRVVPSAGDAAPGLNWPGSCLRCCYFEEIRVLKASLRSGYISMG